MYRDAGSGFVEPLAQARDERIERSGKNGFVNSVAPGASRSCVARAWLTWRTSVSSNGEFSAMQEQRSTTDSDLARRVIVSQSADRDRRKSRGIELAETRPHARQEFIAVERLRQISSAPAFSPATFD